MFFTCCIRAYNVSVSSCLVISILFHKHYNLCMELIQISYHDIIWGFTHANRNPIYRQPHQTPFHAWYVSVLPCNGSGFVIYIISPCRLHTFSDNHRWRTGGGEQPCSSVVPVPVPYTTLMGTQADQSKSVFQITFYKSEIVLLVIILSTVRWSLLPINKGNTFSSVYGLLCYSLTPVSIRQN